MRQKQLGRNANTVITAIIGGVVVLILVTAIAYSVERSSSAPPTKVTEEIGDTTGTIKLYQYGYIEQHLNKKYFEYTTTPYKTNLTVQTEIQSNTLTSIKNRVLRTNRDIYKQNQKNALDTYSILPIEEHITVVEDWTILKSVFELNMSSDYMFIFEVDEEGSLLQERVYQFKVRIEYYSPGPATAGMYEVLSLLEGPPLLGYWIRSPIIVGGTIILFLALNVIIAQKTAHLTKEVYAKHYKYEIFRLYGPRQEIGSEESINKREKWKNWSYMVIMGVIASWVITLEPWPGELIETLTEIIFSALSILSEILLGALFFVLVEVTIENITSSLQGLHAEKHPEALKGHVEISNAFVAGIEKGGIFETGAIWLLMFILMGHLFFIGGFVGSLTKRQIIFAEREKPPAELPDKSGVRITCPHCNSKQILGTKICKKCDQPMEIELNEEERQILNDLTEIYENSLPLTGRIYELLGQLKTRTQVAPQIIETLVKLLKHPEEEIQDMVGRFLRKYS